MADVTCEHLCSYICKTSLSSVPHDVNSLFDITKVEGVMEAAHHILTEGGDVKHLRELLDVARDEIQERQTLKILRLLVGSLDHLMVALPQCLNTQFVPAFRVVKLKQYK